MNYDLCNQAFNILHLRNVLSWTRSLLFIYPSVLIVIGFENADSACCHLAGKHGGIIPCGPPSKACPDRSKYVFWDPYHLSEHTCTIIAKRLMDGGIEEMYPVNLRTLFRR